ncbi:MULTISPECIES: RNA polymerase sigma factor [unclassified Gemella]|uniref:RNA polymerase sigma factor n=1 Tax=unclassified Gemella TaxID=2624949 RepID=UPI0010732A00|nr:MULTISPECIES: sigma factor-like helix-turn-helix DNA-binding protein [unclassified Gemella]MBF0710365.1 sigma-70 family RNA polymerase sigma factor [Gemella sp. GL1.1]MBF0747186.1 sigma-70 family RNA polymerase sigma factor [Gemella sp. 19428wG2_WT2a]NYS27709.1 sigma-70 family RNA polymerase sigma factor [Gemella sp. GL1]TFU58189.1 sigma-70 family RNA polymerase sigma factor [Gemella sp. WT2a]
MERKLYIEYLLKNVFRLEEGFLKDKELGLLDYISNEEKVSLIRDLLVTKDVYSHLDIAKREVLILRYIEGLMVKEIAQKLHYSETRVKQICKEAKETLAMKLGGKYAKEN